MRGERNTIDDRGNLPFQGGGLVVRQFKVHIPDMGWRFADRQASFSQAKTERRGLRAIEKGEAPQWHFVESKWNIVVYVIERLRKSLGRSLDFLPLVPGRKSIPELFRPFEPIENTIKSSVAKD
jgi:hypothetical protein